ncbi:hypothetical protein COJ48_18455 [Bacillus cereus]|nr:hypothetical protein COJ48_18455 [Bacillus cereus]PGP88732.1 hypothetical protein CN997_02390 [Bacillus cereus]
MNKHLEIEPTDRQPPQVPWNGAYEGTLLKDGVTEIYVWMAIYGGKISGEIGGRSVTGFLNAPGQDGFIQFRREGLVSGQYWIPSEEYHGNFLYYSIPGPYVAFGQYFWPTGDGGHWSLILKEYLY